MNPWRTLLQLQRGIDQLPETVTHDERPFASGLWLGLAIGLALGIVVARVLL